MKLRFKTSPQTIREAGDAARGYRVKYIKGYYEVLSKCLESNTYKSKLNSDVTSGFQILPQNKHILAFKFSLDTEDNLNIAVYTCKNALNDATVEVNSIGSIATTEALEAIKNNLQTALKPYCDAYLFGSDNLVENSNKVSLLEANPFKFLANQVKKGVVAAVNKAGAAIDSRAATKDAKRADKSATKRSNDLLKEISNQAQNDLKQLAPNYTITTSGKNDHLYIQIQAPYIADIKLGQNPEDPKAIRVVGIIGADQKQSKGTISTLDSLTKMLAKRLGLKNNLEAVYEYLKMEPSDEDDDIDGDTADETDTETSDETAETSTETSAYQIAAIAAGAKTLKQQDIADLLESSSTNTLQHTWLTESVLPLKHNVDSAKYLKVYDDIKHDNNAVVALVKRFIHRAFNIPSANIDANIAHDPLIFDFYVKLLTKSKFKIESMTNPALYALSVCIDKRQTLDTKLAKGIVAFFADSDNGAAVDRLKKLNDCANIPSGKFATIDDITKSNKCILYGNFKNITVPAILFKAWYNFDIDTRIQKLVKMLPGHSELQSAFCSLVDRDESEASTICSSPQSIKAAVFTANNNFRSVDNIKTLMSELAELSASVSSSNNKVEISTETATELKQQLLSDDISDPLANDDFYKLLISELKKKNLEGDALLAMQKTLMSKVSEN